MNQQQPPGGKGSATPWTPELINSRLAALGTSLPVKPANPRKRSPNTQMTPEETARMEQHIQKWMKIALRTEEIQPEKIFPAVDGMYHVVGAEVPRKVVVGSPLAMGLAGGLAAGVWFLREQDQFQHIHPGDLDLAVEQVIGKILFDDEVRIRAGVLDAIRVATDGWDQETFGEDRDRTGFHTVDQISGFLRESVRNWERMYQGGNMWAPYDCYITGARDVLGIWLDDFVPYVWWEMAAVHGSFRMVHEKFCILSDFPDTIKLNDRNQPHCDDGPSHRWRDGWALYFWNGVRIPRWVIEEPHRITFKSIMEETNAEVRRCMIEKMGWERLVKEGEFTVLHRDTLESKFPVIPVTDTVGSGLRMVTSYRAGTENGELLEAKGLVDLEGRPLKFVRLKDPSTDREYVIRVRHDHKRVYEAVGWTFKMSEQEYKHSSYIRQGDVMLIPLTGGDGKQQHS